MKMNKIIFPTGSDKDACTALEADAPKQDFRAEHRQRVREWLSQKPFGALVNSLKSRTRQDQLKCMLEVESWLLKCHPKLYSVDTHASDFLKRCNRFQSCLDFPSALRF